MTEDDNNAHANTVAEQLRLAEENDTIPASRPDYSSIRLIVGEQGEQLNMVNPIDYLVGLLLEGKRYDGNWDSDEQQVVQWAVASWCQEMGWVPDLRDYDAGEQVERGDDVDCLKGAFEVGVADQERSKSDLPRIAYRTEAGETRRVRYERVAGKPWTAERIVERPDGEGGWDVVGRETLTELHVDGECRSAISFVDGP